MRIKLKLKKSKKPFRVTLGRRGEMVGWSFLQQQGYKLLDKNYRCPVGEVDVICEKKGKLVFVEIKTRAQPRFGTPQEGVSLQKQRRMIQLAQWYLTQNRQLRFTAVSFAVLAITWPRGGEPTLRLIEDAFTADNNDSKL